MEKKDTNQGFIFEVDLDYPDTLWDSHSDYPLAPEKLKVDKIDKLICSFKPKRHYVVHYQNLKQYLEEGMILKNVHRGIKFYHITLDGALYQKKYRSEKDSFKRF